MTEPMPQQQSVDLSLEQALRQAVVHHQAGQLEEAERLYRAILQAQPQQPDANHNLGLLAVQVKQPAMGLPHFKAALMTNPGSWQYWISYIDALIQAGQLQVAREMLSLGRKQGLQGDAVDALAVRLETEKPADNTPIPIAKPDKSQQRKPAKPVKASGQRGAQPSAQEVNALVALFNQGRYAEGEVLARGLTTRFPRDGFGWKALGAVLKSSGRNEEALTAMRKAAELLPRDAQVQDNLGVVLRDMNKLPEAEACHRRALAIAPNFTEAHFNLGNIFQAQDKLAEADACYRRALKLQPNYASAHGNLGMVCKEQGRFSEAESSYRRALEIKPDYADAHCNLGTLFRERGRFVEAESSYRRALEIKPDFIEAHSNLLFSLSDNPTLDAETLFVEHCRFGEQFEAHLRANWPQHGNSRDPERCLQVGFVSGDLRNHAVANFIEPVLAHLADHPGLSLHAYYNHAVEDAVTQRIRRHVTHWHPIVGLSDDALAQKIQVDGIDILIDLSGHTAKHRLLAFARKPAPVQASWIGYPGTTGLRAVDYYLADRFLLPPGQFDGQFTEKIARLPANAPFLPYLDASPVNPLPALSNGYVTFGSFNRLNKLNRPVIALWSQLLRALPDSRMLLAGMPPDSSGDTMIDWFAQEGIARERLSLHARCDMKAYMDLHQQVDICLDTFPCNGGTTTQHALWMGVPTLTLAGKSMPGRVGLAIFSRVGLQDFVVERAEDFAARGSFLAGNLSTLAELRAGLRQRLAQSPLRKPEVIAAGLERALRTMWQRWCAGLPAESFEVSLQDIDGIAQEAGK